MDDGDLNNRSSSIRKTTKAIAFQLNHTLIQQRPKSKQRYILDFKITSKNYLWNKTNMKIKAIVHQAKEGGYWAEVPALPGCITEGDTQDELLANLEDAVKGWLEVANDIQHKGSEEQIVEIVV